MIAVAKSALSQFATSATLPSLIAIRQTLLFLFFPLQRLMVRVKFSCGRLVAGVSAVVIGLALGSPNLAVAQAVAPNQAAAPFGAQPAWVNQTPVLQVGPNGAVNLDQPVVTYAMPYSAAQVPATPYASQPMAAPYVGQPWGPQAVQPQPAWGAPLVPSATGLTAGPVQPFFVHRTSVFGEAIYMRPRSAEVAYALPIDGPVAPTLGNEVPVGPVAVVDPGYDINFRVGANVALDKGSSIRGQYTRLRFDDDDAVTVTAPDLLRSLVTHPLGANTATDRLDAAATLDYELDIVDLDYRGLWYGCECNCAYAINYVGGVEYATLDQIFSSRFATVGLRTVDTAIDFTGVGMRLGLEGERYFPHSGFFVYGNGITTLLFGEFDASYTQRDAFNVVEATTAWSAGRIVPVLEMELGAGWLGVNRHLRLSAGYRVSAWFNVVTTDEWIWAVQNSEFRNMSGTLTFDGIVGRAEWLF